MGFLRSPWFWIVLVIVVVGGGGWMWSKNAAGKKQQAQAAAMSKTPESPYSAVAQGKADVEGGIVNVAARRAGIVREVFVQEGDRVTRGQILARQEDDEPKLAVQSAAAAVNQAKAQLELIEVQLATARREKARLQTLAGANYVAAQRLDQADDAIRSSQANLDAQKAAVATAQAKLDQARYELELTVIRAPADGVIVRRYANPGAGASTLNVSNMFDLQPDAARIVRAEIPESAIPSVEIGQSVQISPEAAPDKVYAGKVLRRAAMFGARKLQSDDPTERSDERVVEVVVSADEAPFLIGQRVLVKFMKPGHAAPVQAAAAAPEPAPGPAKPAA
jgi:HlyD family secretion protein